MLKRRTVLLGGLITVFGGLPCECSSQTKLGGCAISADAAKRYLGSSVGDQDIVNSIVTKSGNKDFDYAAAQTLSVLSDMFEVLPGFAYFKINSRNAFATSGRLMGKTDGTVLFGSELLFDVLNAPEAPDAIFSGICAHEFAHILQFQRGVDLNKNQPTARRGELHADFMAGYFAGARKLQNSNFPAAVIAVSHGDLGDYDFNNPQHHGTPAERSAAIVRGFEIAYRDRKKPMEAFDVGINYAITV